MPLLLPQVCIGLLQGGVAGQEVVYLVEHVCHLQHALQVLLVLEVLGQQGQSLGFLGVQPCYRVVLHAESPIS